MVDVDKVFLFWKSGQKEEEVNNLGHEQTRHANLLKDELTKKILRNKERTKVQCRSKRNKFQIITDSEPLMYIESSTVHLTKWETITWSNFTWPNQLIESF